MKINNLHYNKKTGLFTNVKTGKIYKANCRGYIQIQFENKKYYAHQLAWFFVNGEFSSKHIDHKNHDKSDNRIVNLRECSVSENKCNSIMYKNNTTGYKGVTFNKNKKTNKFRSVITIGYKRKHLGYFNTALEASIVYEKAAKELHGQFYYNNEELI